MNPVMMMMGGGGGSDFGIVDDFTRLSVLPSRYTLSSDSGYKRNASGVWADIAANTSLLQHDINGNALGWAVLPAYSNLLIHSNELADSSWQQYNESFTRTSNVGMDIFGENHAVQVKTTAANQRLFQYTNVAIGKTYTLSVWVKHLSGDVNFDLWVVGAGGPRQTFTATSEWAEYSVTWTATATETVLSRIYQSTTIPASHLICQAQLTETSIPMPPIVTGASTVSRAADHLSFDLKGLAQAQDVSVIQKGHVMTSHMPDYTNTRLLSLDGSDGYADMIAIYGDRAGGRVRGASGSGQATWSTGSDLTKGVLSPYVLALAWTNGGSIGSKNGASYHPNLPNNPGASPVLSGTGHFNVTSNRQGAWHIVSQLEIYKSQLTQTQLNEKTA